MQHAPKRCNLSLHVVPQTTRLYSLKCCYPAVLTGFRDACRLTREWFLAETSCCAKHGLILPCTLANSHLQPVQLATRFFHRLWNANTVHTDYNLSFFRLSFFLSLFLYVSVCPSVFLFLSSFRFPFDPLFNCPFIFHSRFTSKIFIMCTFRHVLLRRSNQFERDEPRVLVGKIQRKRRLGR